MFRETVVNYKGKLMFLSRSACLSLPNLWRPQVTSRIITKLRIRILTPRVNNKKSTNSTEATLEYVRNTNTMNGLMNCKSQYKKIKLYMSPYPDHNSPTWCLTLPCLLDRDDPNGRASVSLYHRVRREGLFQNKCAVSHLACARAFVVHTHKEWHTAQIIFWNKVITENLVRDQRSDSTGALWSWRTSWVVSNSRGDLSELMEYRINIFKGSYLMWFANIRRVCSS